MLEIGACMEMKAKSSSLVESTDAEFSDISFEELLAQEKKDAFWLVLIVDLNSLVIFIKCYLILKMFPLSLSLCRQRNGKLKPCSG